MVLWVKWELNSVGQKKEIIKDYFLCYSDDHIFDLNSMFVSRQAGNLHTLNRDSDSAQIAPRFAVDQSEASGDVFLLRMLRTCTLGDLSLVHWVNPGSLFDVVLDERYQVHST